MKILCHSGRRYCVRKIWPSRDSNPQPPVQVQCWDSNPHPRFHKFLALVNRYINLVICNVLIKRSTLEFRQDINEIVLQYYYLYKILNNLTSLPNFLEIISFRTKPKNTRKQRFQSGKYCRTNYTFI